MSNLTKKFLPCGPQAWWSVNDGLSGNLLETSGNRPQRFLASSRISTIEKKFLKRELYIKNLETCWKPTGNLCGRFPAGFWILKNIHIDKKLGNLPETCGKPAAEVFRRFPAGFRRFPDNPSLTDHTVSVQYSPPAG